MNEHTQPYPTADARFAFTDIREFSEGTPWVVVYRSVWSSGESIFEAISPAFGRNCMGYGTTPEEACYMLSCAALDALLRLEEER